MDIMTPARAFNASKNGSKKTRDKKVNEVAFFQPAKEFYPMIDEVSRLLKEKLKRIQGALVENNKFCASVHFRFRCVEEKNLSLLVKKVRSVLKDYTLLHLTLGKKVLEIRPSIEWHKENTLEYLLDSVGLSNSNNVMSLYVREDRTNEEEGSSGFNTTKKMKVSEADTGRVLRNIAWDTRWCDIMAFILAYRRHLSISTASSLMHGISFTYNRSLSTTFREKRDTFSPINVPTDRLWGAQTQRSLQNFEIGGERE